MADDDIVLRVTATAICGSDLHIYRGKIPMMKYGDIITHRMPLADAARGYEIFEKKKEEDAGRADSLSPRLLASRPYLFRLHRIKPALSMMLTGGAVLGFALAATAQQGDGTDLPICTNVFKLAQSRRYAREAASSEGAGRLHASVEGVLQRATTRGSQGYYGPRPPSCVWTWSPCATR
jgi:hypothetical protein